MQLVATSQAKCYKKTSDEHGFQSNEPFQGQFESRQEIFSVQSNKNQESITFLQL